MKNLMLAILVAAACSPNTRPKPVVTDRDKALHAIGLQLAALVEPYSLTTGELDRVIDGVRAGHQAKGALKAEEFAAQLNAFALERYAARVQPRKDADAKLVAPLVNAPGARKLPSGVVVIPVSEGSGRTPTKFDFVKVQYRATFADGAEFDSSHGQPKLVQMDRAIGCWTDGLQLMRVGGKARLVCPSETAYGDFGGRFSGIPGGATLVFDIELLSIEKQ